MVNLSNMSRWEKSDGGWLSIPLQSHLVWYGRLGATGSGIAAYDYDTGATKWSYPFGALADRGSGYPVWAGTQTILLQFSGLLIAIDSETGTEKWRRTMGCCYNLGVLSPNQGIVADGNGFSGALSYYGFDPRTGDGTGAPFSAPSAF